MHLIKMLRNGDEGDDRVQQRHQSSLFDINFSANFTKSETKSKQEGEREENKAK